MALEGWNCTVQSWCAIPSRESEEWSHSVWNSSEFALTEYLYTLSKAAPLQYVIYLYIVELSSWHVDQCLICSFVLTWYITQSIFHMPSAKWKWLKLFLLKPMARHITVSCIKCDLTNILLLCWSQNCGCRASDASHSLVPGIWAFECTFKPHLWLRVRLCSNQKWIIWKCGALYPGIPYLCFSSVSAQINKRLLYCINFILDPLLGFSVLCVFPSHMVISQSHKHLSLILTSCLTWDELPVKFSHPQSWKAGGKNSNRKVNRA